jgi:hypothetical protein
LPYGVKGGDTKESDAWMERCVARVTAKGTPKLQAILICKSQHRKTKG